jgi:membrane protease YdiL (CAAX protease family)
VTEPLPSPPAAALPPPPFDPRASRGPWPLATWTLSETIPVFFMCFGIEVYLSIVVFGMLRLHGGLATSIIGVLAELGFAIPVIVWVRRAGKGSLATLGLGRRSGADVLSGVGMGFLALVAVVAVAAATVAIATAVEGHTPRMPDPIGGSGPWRAVGYATAVIAAPICEEILFRGFLFQGLRRRFDFWGAAVITSGAFAMAHFDLLRMPGTFVGGLLLAGIFERRRNLLSSIAAHFVVNAVVVWAAIASH